MRLQRAYGWRQDHKRGRGWGKDSRIHGLRVLGWREEVDAEADET